MEHWQIYLSFIPSIAVILTGVNRMTLGVTDQINAQILVEKEVRKDIILLKIKQLRRLSIATMLMYIALAILVISALLSGNNILGMMYQNIPIFVSITLFFIAIGLLVSFSFNALILQKKQFGDFEL